MRHIACRFEDGTTFLEHLEAHITDSGQIEPSLAFLGRFGLRIGELIRVVVLIEDTEESHTLHMRVADRRPTALGSGSGPRWRYTATPTREDRVWLQMLAGKCATYQRIRPTAQTADTRDQRVAG